MRHLLRGSAIIVGLLSGAAAVPLPAYAAPDVTVACGDTAGLIRAVTALDGPGGTIRLADDCVYAFEGAYGTSSDALPPVTGNVTIEGGNSTLMRSTDSATRFRVLEVSATGTLRLHAVQVRAGDAAFGGGIQVHAGGRLTLEDSTVGGNRAAGYGGGIYNQGTTTLRRSSVSGNVADFGAGIENADGARLTVGYSTIDGNQATTEGGGIDNSAGTLTVEASTLAHNRARDEGGGAVSSHGASHVTLTDSVLSDNTAGLDGGAVENGAGAALKGTRTTLQENRAGRDGGGVSNEGTADLDQVQVTQNSAGRDGGGINNETGAAGGTTAALALGHSTIAGNRAVRHGGGVNDRTGSGTALQDGGVAGNRPGNCFPLNTVPGCRD
ncbi:right-handed parallel beta-helix repeat-containing protein [Streptomyces sp. NPDC048514]|uniref:right-handed parallel beta-helix repeat-containing protein n=1 Tax=Streptomyces sp. NPDC048514 TaxID=3365564 RepID=UPI00371FAC46